MQFDTNKEKYIASLRRVFLAGEMDSEKGNKILSRKLKVLELSVDEAEVIKKDLLKRYNHFEELLDDLSADGDLGELELEEIEEFKDDLNITDEEEAYFLKKAGISEVGEIIEVKNELEVLPFEQTYHFSGTNHSITIDPSKKTDGFFFAMKATYMGCLTRFDNDYYAINDLRDFNSRKIVTLFYSNFGTYFDFVHNYAVDVLKIDTIAKDDLVKAFDLYKLADIGEYFNDIRSEMVDRVEMNDYNRKASRGSSTMLGVGNIGFMAGIAAFSGARSISRSIGDSNSNRKLASNLSDEAREIFLGTSNKLMRIFTDGMVNLYTILSNTSGGHLRNIKDIMSDDTNSDALKGNFEKQFDINRELYIEKYLKALMLNPLNPDSYECLEDAFGNNNSAKKVLYEIAMQYPIMSYNMDHYRSKVNYYDFLIKKNDIFKTDNDSLKAVFKELYSDFITGSFTENLYVKATKNTGLLKRISNVELEESNHLLAYYEFENNAITFGLYGLYLISSDVSCIKYNEIKDVGVVNQKLIITTITENEYDINVTSANNIMIEKICDYVLYLKAYWQDNSAAISEVKSILNAQSVQVVDQSILGLLDINPPVMYQLKYILPSYYYNEKWQSLNGTSYINDDQYKDCQALAEILSLDAKAVLKIEQPTRDRYYLKSLNQFSDELPSRETLMALATKFQVSKELMYASEINLFETGITFEAKELDVFILSEYKKLIFNKQYIDSLFNNQYFDRDFKLDDRCEDEKVMFAHNSKKDRGDSIVITNKAVIINTKRHMYTDITRVYNDGRKMTIVTSKGNLQYIFTKANTMSFMKLLVEITQLINGAYKSTEEYKQRLDINLDKKSFEAHIVGAGDNYFGHKLFLNKEENELEFEIASVVYDTLSDADQLLFIIYNAEEDSLDDIEDVTMITGLKWACSLEFIIVNNVKIMYEDIDELTYSEEHMLINSNGQQYNLPIDLIKHAKDLHQLMNGYYKIKKSEKEIFDSRVDNVLEIVTSLSNTLEKNEAIDCFIGDYLNKSKLDVFVKVYNSKFRDRLELDDVVGFYDDTISRNGKKGYAVTFEGVYSLLSSEKGFIPFDELSETPKVDSIFNTKIFLQRDETKHELYMTGVKNPEYMYKLIKNIYDFYEEE